MLARYLALMATVASASAQANAVTRAQLCQQTYMAGAQTCTSLSNLAACINGPMSEMSGTEAAFWQSTLDGFATAAGCSLIPADTTNPKMTIRNRDLEVRTPAGHDVNFVRNGRQEIVSIFGLNDRVDSAEERMNATVDRAQAIADALATFTSNQHDSISQQVRIISQTVTSQQGTFAGMLEAQLSTVNQAQETFQTSVAGELSGIRTAVAAQVSAAVATANAALSVNAGKTLLGTYASIVSALEVTPGYLMAGELLNSTAALAQVDRYFSLAAAARECTSGGLDMATGRCFASCRSRVASNRDSFMYAGHCMRSIEPNGDSDRIPSGCIPYYPTTNPRWNRNNYDQLCRLSRTSMGRSTNCGNVDMDSDGGLCPGRSSGGLWAVMAFESNTSPDVYTNQDWWSWRPTNGGGNCQLEEDTSTVAVYACR